MHLRNEAVNIAWFHTTFDRNIKLHNVLIPAMGWHPIPGLIPCFASIASGTGSGPRQHCIEQAGMDNG